MSFWGNRLFKSEEELADEEKNQLEAIEKRKIEDEERKKQIEKAISEIKNNKYVKVALLNGIDTSKTADYILKKEKDHFRTFKTLADLAIQLDHLLQYVDLMAKYYPNPEQIEYQRAKNFFPVITAPGQSTSKSERPIISNEGENITKIIKGLEFEKRRIYNNQKLVNAPLLLIGVDDDPEATPITFFKINRIRKYISSLLNNTERLIYLKKMKNAFINEDKRGSILLEHGRQIKSDKGFMKHMEDEIRIYEDALKHESEDVGKIKKKTLAKIGDKQFEPDVSNLAGAEQLSTRQIVILLLTLMYGKPEVPSGITKNSVTKFIKLLKNLDAANINKYVGDATGAKPESIRERQCRIDDIKEVTHYLQRLGINKGRWKDVEGISSTLQTDIQSIKAFKQEDKEEKQNNW